MPQKWALRPSRISEAGGSRRKCPRSAECIDPLTALVVFSSVSTRPVNERLRLDKNVNKAFSPELGSLMASHFFASPSQVTSHKHIYSDSSPTRVQVA